MRTHLSELLALGSHGPNVSEARVDLLQVPANCSYRLLQELLTPLQDHLTPPKYLHPLQETR